MKIEYLKLKRVEEQIQYLENKIIKFNKEHPIQCKTEYLKDRKGYELFIDDTPHEDLLHQFGIIVGEIIHNLRSSLDNLVFSLAKLKNDPPKTEKTLSFPICVKESDFNRWAKHNRIQLDNKVFNLIKKIQPFNRNNQNTEGTPETDPLVAIQSLSNSDKHRLPCTALFPPKTIEFNGQCSFLTEEDAALNCPPDIKVFLHNKIKKGNLLLRHTTKTPIKKSEGSFQFGGTVMIEINGDMFELILSVKHHLYYVKLIFNQFETFFAST